MTTTLSPFDVAVRIWAAGSVLMLALGCGSGGQTSTGNGNGGAGEGGDKSGGAGGVAGGGRGGAGAGGAPGPAGAGGAATSDGGAGSIGAGADGAASTDKNAGDSAASSATDTKSADAVAGTGVDGGGPPSAIPPTGLGPWTGKDNVPPTTSPPGNFSPSRVPMFVSLGFDDNPDGEGVSWVVSAFSALKNPAGTGNAATYDGTTVKASFYHSSVYASAASSWKAAHAAGFETGNHTINHFHGATVDAGKNFTQAGWTTEIQGCNDFLTSSAVGVKREEIYGFRTPFLQYNANVFPVLKTLNFWYDCSIEEGHQPEQDGTNYLWPYTLDSGSPGNATHPNLVPIKTWPTGLWEMPAYRVVVPPDSEAQKYGVPVGLRAKLINLHPDRVSITAGKITGLDYNLWYDFLVTKPEFVATLKYTLDSHRQGNRAPMLLGMHSAIYASADEEPLATASVADRRSAVVEFLKYALTFPEVRIVPTKAVLDWIRNPVPLN